MSASKFRDVILRIDKKIVWLSHNAAALLMGVAAVLVFFQVVTRFVLGASATWTEILARGLIVWVVFLGSAVTFRQGAMISILAVARAIPVTANLWLQRGVTCLTLIFLWILVWYGYLITVRVSHQMISMLEIPYTWFYAAIPIGAACAMVSVLAHHLEVEMDPEHAADIHFDEEDLAEGHLYHDESDHLQDGHLKNDEEKDK